MQGEPRPFPDWSIPHLRGRAHIVLEPAMGAGGALTPHIWLEPPAGAYMQARGFWISVNLGPARSWLWRFELAFTALNRAAFALVEVRPALDEGSTPPGPWLPSSKPRYRPS